MHVNNPWGTLSVVYSVILLVSSNGLDHSQEDDSGEVRNDGWLGRMKRQAEDGDLTVRVEQGQLQGHHMESAAGGSFIAFRGIPYAKPPLGHLRFKDAHPPDTWDGIRDARTEGNICPQPDFMTPELLGEEDCLYLNVYTPTLTPLDGEYLPVMLFVHGGGFIQGSGSYDLVGPDYLVEEDVIVVTINYRLGAFGFLYLREAAPGNVGLKDQVAAMRWVKKNINNFGGDPNKITIFGQSSGGASIHYQLLSPMSRGLYRAAIAESGSALNPWAQHRTPYETSQRLAKVVGCPVGNDSATVECLRGIPTEDIMKAQTSDDLMEKDRPLYFPFVPTVDLKFPGVENFLPDNPLKLIKEGLTNPVPFLTGVNNNESHLVLHYRNFLDPKIAKELDESWKSFLPTELFLPKNAKENDEALEELRDYFMDGKPLTNASVPDFMKMLTDVYFGNGLYFTLSIMSKQRKAPLYEYYFTIDDKLNSPGIPPAQGAKHGDEIGYLFRSQYLSNVPANSTASTERERMVRLWTNFAKYRNPTPHSDSLLNAKWKSYSRFFRNYLEIGRKLRPAKNLNADQFKFWKKFYKKYGCGGSFCYSEGN